MESRSVPTGPLWRFRGPLKLFVLMRKLWRFGRRRAWPISSVPWEEEEVDPEDIPHADRNLCYENSDVEEVVETIPWASPPHQKSYDAVPEHYAP
ncbi:hypothetical protein SOVF_023240, partial [Spinacia oleracea]